MKDTNTPQWNRHRILAEIKIRFGSLKAFAKTTPLDADHFSVALARPYPSAEQYIAKALDVPIQTLWPDRYDATGHRRLHSVSTLTRLAANTEEQKTHSRADRLGMK